MKMLSAETQRGCKGWWTPAFFSVMVSPFPTCCWRLGHCAKHWPGAFSVLCFVFCRHYQEGGKGCPTAGSHGEWGSHHPHYMGLRIRVAQVPLKTGKMQGRKVGFIFFASQLSRAGSMAVHFQVLFLVSPPATLLPFPQTSPAALLSPTLLPFLQYTCYLFSFTAIWAFCSAGLIFLKIQTLLTEADHNNMPHSSSLFFPDFCQWSGLNWHWLVVGQVQRHQALSEHPLEWYAHMKMSTLENLCDCT